MATITRYINTASTPGGDGTTNATSGANRAYASMSEWEAAEQTDLVTDGDTHVVYCTGSTVDNTAVLIDGWTTGASNDISIIGDTLTLPYWDTSKYRIELGSTSSYPFRCNESFVNFKYLQVGQSTNVSGVAGFVLAGASGAFLVEYCIAYSEGDSSAAFAFGSEWNTVGGTTIKVKNSLFYHKDSTPGYQCNSVYMHGSSSTLWHVHNVTAYGGTAGFEEALGGWTNRVTLKNCLAANATTCFVDDGGLTSATDYNAADDATTTGSNSRDSQTFTFNDTSTWKLDITSGDAGALDYGVDLGSDSDLAVTDDIIGTSRAQGSAFDIGHFEVVTGGVNYERTLSSSIDTQDQQQAYELKVRQLLDQLNIQDPIIVEKLLYRLLSSNVDLTDVIVRTIVEGFVAERTLSSSISVNDLVLSYELKYRLLVSNTDIVDLITRTITSGAIVVERTLQSNLEVVDKELIEKQVSRYVLSTVSIVDAILQDKLLYRLLSDNPDVVDSIIRTLEQAPQDYVRTLVDNIDLQDEISRELFGLLRGFVVTALTTQPIIVDTKKRYNILVDTKE